MEEFVNRIVYHLLESNKLLIQLTVTQPHILNKFILIYPRCA